MKASEHGAGSCACPGARGSHEHTVLQHGRGTRSPDGLAVLSALLAVVREAPCDSWQGQGVRLCDSLGFQKGDALGGGDWEGL